MKNIVVSHLLLILGFLFHSNHCIGQLQAIHQSKDSLLQLYGADTTGKNWAKGTIENLLIKFKEIPPAGQQFPFHVLKRISPVHFIINGNFDNNWQQKILYAVPANSMWKASPALLNALHKSTPGQSLKLTIVFNNNLENLDSSWMGNVQTIHWHTTAPYGIFIVKVKDIPGILSENFIKFCDIARAPQIEGPIKEKDFGLNNIESAQSAFPNFANPRSTISIKENMFDTTDIDLLYKQVTNSRASKIFSLHATDMAVIMSGIGNSGYHGKGISPGANLLPSNFEVLLPDDDAFFLHWHCLLQNHSYGVGIENYYGAEALAYDQQVNRIDSLVHIFSSGNSGTTTPDAGLYKGIHGFANLTGTFKQAKNVITVGATDLDGQVSTLSSRGPGFDGRIQPFIVAYGPGGTSEAAAMVSGSVNILQNAYRYLFQESPSIALIKALLMNTADTPLNNPLSYQSGYGSLNTRRALNSLLEQHFIKASLNPGGNFQNTIPVPPGTAILKVSIAWNDPAANIDTDLSLINDLDLQLVDPAGKVYHPWVLSYFPSKDSLAASPRRGIDHLNNQELTSVQNPVAGDYLVNVHSQQLSENNQEFYMVWDFVPSNYFEWEFPNKNLILTPGESNTIRWHSNIGEAANLYYSLDAGITWKSIGSNVQLKDGAVNWEIPEGIFHKALLKIENNAQSFTSDTFRISPKPDISVLYNCKENLALQWAGIEQATAYTIYAIIGNRLLPIQETEATEIVLPKQDQLPLYYSVAPVSKDGWVGQTGNVINYQMQGVGCFVKQILADKITGSTVHLQLRLSAAHLLEEMSWEKLQQQSFKKISGERVNGNNFFQRIDTVLQPGVVYYRAKLTTKSGQTIYTDTVAVDMVGSGQYFLYPNPVQDVFTLLNADYGDDIVVRIMDAKGITRRMRLLTGLRQSFDVKQLPAGQYWCVIYRKGRLEFKIPFIKL